MTARLARVHGNVADASGYKYSRTRQPIRRQQSDHVTRLQVDDGYEGSGKRAVSDMVRTSCLFRVG